MLTVHPNKQERYLFTTLPVLLVLAETELAHRLRRLRGREALWPALAVIVGLLFLKMLTKTVGVWPLARTHFMNRREASYTTLLMATGLTFGTISALFGFQNHIIDQRQYTILVTVVILSAFVPTLVAQKFFQPTKDAMRAWGRRYSYGLGVLSVEDAETETNNGID